VSGLPDVKGTLLYSFIHIPKYINMNFLGLFDISEKNIILAILSGVVTFLQAKYSQPISANDDKTKSALSDFNKAMQLQMKFGFPILMFIISLSLSSAIALYFITSGIFTILQELYIRKHINK
jgi:membrane protein insertase Oxa1/YidC/SpoIIIJ